MQFNIKEWLRIAKRFEIIINHIAFYLRWFYKILLECHFTIVISLQIFTNFNGVKYSFNFQY